MSAFCVFCRNPPRYEIYGAEWTSEQKKEEEGSDVEKVEKKAEEEEEENEEEDIDFAAHVQDCM